MSARALRKKQSNELPAAAPVGAPVAQRDAALLGGVREATSGPGQSLDSGIAEQMGERFGHDFSTVRVHTDDRAAASASTLDARAYTLGNNVVFGAGEYTPAAPEGQRLIAHELAHVVQQSSIAAPAGPLSKGLTVSEPGDPLEQAADAAAESAMGDTDTLDDEPAVATTAMRKAAGDPLIQRKAAATLAEAAALAAEETSDADAEAEQVSVEVPGPVGLATATPQDASGGGGGGGAPPPPAAEPSSAPPVPLAAAPAGPEIKSSPIAPLPLALPAFNPAALLPIPTTPPIQAPPAIPPSPLAGVAALPELPSAAPPPARPAGGFGGLLGGMASTVQDSTSAAASGAPSYAGQDAGLASGAASSAAESATAYADQAAGAVSQQAGAAAGTVGEVAEAAAGAVSQQAGAAAGTVGEVAEAAAGTVSEQAGAAAGAVGEQAGAAAGAVGTPAATSGFAASASAASAPAAAPAALPAAAAAGGAAAPAARAGNDGGGAASAPAGDLAPASPAEDPAFQAVAGRSAAVAGQQASHAPAGGMAGAAQAAADPQGSDVAMAAQGRQVGEIEAAPVAAFDAVAFKNRLLEKIAASAPKNLEEADEFKSNNKLDAAKGELGGAVKGEKDRAGGAVEEKAAQPPTTDGISPKPVAALPTPEAGPPPAPLGAAAAAPKPKGEGQVSAPFQQASASLDDQMASASVTEKQLANANEPSFSQALDSKKEAQADAASKPGQVRQQEGAVLQQAQAEAEMTAEQKTAAMSQERNQLLAQVFGMQGETKGADEQARRAVADKIAGIYQTTRDETQKILDELDPWVESKFSQGADAAKAVFERHVGEKMDAYKDDRYGGIGGGLLWASDKLFGMPDEVNVFFTEGRQVYLAEMDKALTMLSEHVAAELNRAKARVAQGRQEIQTYVAGLSPELQQVGKDAVGKIEEKFSELESGVDSKQGELVDNLAQKYNEKLKEVDSRIEQLQAENKGLVDKALDAVVGVIGTILELKDMLLGVLSRAADAVMKIIEDPIGFLGNLLAGVTQGLQQFVGKIGTHLQTGLLEWLTGTVSATGLKMPAQLDLPGIFDLVLQIFGLTKENIKAQIIKALGPSGETIWAALEGTLDVIKILIGGGLPALWDYVKDQVGDLYTMVIEQIKSMIATEVIEAGVQWLIGILGGPAGAFIKAAQAIIKVVMWFVNNGSRMMSLINAVIDGIGAIASGALGDAANFVEGALAKAIPMAISFLASLLNLDGIATKVTGIIDKVRAPVNKGIDWVVKKAVAAGKKILGKLKGNKAKDGEAKLEGDGEPLSADKQAKFDAGVAAVQGLPEQSEEEIGKSLGTIKTDYGFETLNAVTVKSSWKITAIMRSSKTKVFTIKRTYEANPKHDQEGSRADGSSIAKMDLHPEIAQSVLDGAIEAEGKKQLFGVHNGRIYAFQPHQDGKYHGYPISGKELVEKYPKSVQQEVAGRLGLSWKKLRKKEEA